MSNKKNLRPSEAFQQIANGATTNFEELTEKKPTTPEKREVKISEPVKPVTAKKTNTTASPKTEKVMVYFDDEEYGSILELMGKIESGLRSMKFKKRLTESAFLRVLGQIAVQDNTTNELTQKILEKLEVTK